MPAVQVTGDVLLELVSLIFASWNHAAAWLRQLEAFRMAA